MESVFIKKKKLFIIKIDYKNLIGFLIIKELN